jgi:hypothetical protein
MVMDKEASSWALQHVQEALNELRNEYMRPSVVFRAKLLKVGDDKWSAYYSDPTFDDTGTILLAGRFCVVGSTPDEAMRNFDKLWITKPESK